MAALKERTFIPGMIADKIGTADRGKVWTAAMGFDLYVYENDRERKRFVLPQTYRSLIYVQNENFIRCHNVEINLMNDKVTILDFSSLCNAGNPAPTQNHVCTNVAWSKDGSNALASYRFFHARNGGSEQGNSLNQLFGLTGFAQNIICQKLDEHSYMPFDCTQAGSRYMASHTGQLKIWDDLVPVQPDLVFDAGLSMDYLFFVDAEKYLILINAAGKVIEVNTVDWHIENEWLLNNYSSKNLVAVSANGHLLATGNNEGDCHIYIKSTKGYSELLHQNLNGIVTALAIVDNRVIAGINGKERRGTGMYEIVY